MTIRIFFKVITMDKDKQSVCTDRRQGQQNVSDMKVCQLQYYFLVCFTVWFVFTRIMLYGDRGISINMNKKLHCYI